MRQELAALGGIANRYAAQPRPAVVTLGTRGGARLGIVQSLRQELEATSAANVRDFGQHIENEAIQQRRLAVKNSMAATIRISLAFIRPESRGLRFRVAFDSSSARWLLPYPDVSGLHLKTISGDRTPEWQAQNLIMAPRDEFVLNPGDCIAFDLVVKVSASSEESRWTIQLSPGEYDVRYIFAVAPDEARYDYLGKGSRFADMTPPWVGRVESNTVRVRV